MSKVIAWEDVASKVPAGSTVMIGGFMCCGTPEGIVEALIKEGVQDLTIIANDTGFPTKGIGRLVATGAAKAVIASHIGTNPETGKKMVAGELEVQLVPQGTLAEQIRCKGAGLGGFLTPTGVGTVVEEGKEKKIIEGKEYLLERPLGADIALLKAWKADTKGNLVYRQSARNFNPLMAKAAKLVICEVEEIVEVGAISPEEVHTPHIFVDFLVGGTSNG